MAETPFVFDEASQTFFKTDPATDRAFVIRRYLEDLWLAQGPEIARGEAHLMVAAALRFIFDLEGQAAAENVLTNLRQALASRLAMAAPIEPGTLSS